MRLEHIVSIVASLLKNCSGITKQRVVAKFVENDLEKVSMAFPKFWAILSKQ